MKSRPILFSAAMIAAILDGRKTQTRRVLKAGFDADKMELVRVEAFLEDEPDLLGVQAFFNDPAQNSDYKMGARFPFGRVGDGLWVREKWQVSGWDMSEEKCTIRYFDGAEQEFYLNEPEPDRNIFTAEWLQDHLLQLSEKGYYHVKFKKDEVWFNRTKKPLRWQPGIHMPREASRICLEITGIRVERLHNISETDAVAEGIEVIDRWPDGRPIYKFYSNHPGNNGGWLDPTTSFMSLWDSIHGTPTGNPWVWVIEFKRKDEAND